MNGGKPCALNDMRPFTIHGLTPSDLSRPHRRSPWLVALALRYGHIVARHADLRAKVSSWVTAHEPEIINELITLLAIPNVAADRPNIRRNAEQLRAMLAARGFKAQLLETTGNPLVYGDLVVPGATRTLLLYSHYDGQPVDPKAWKQADPFTPVLRSARLDRGGTDMPGTAGLKRFDPEWRLYARSSADDKAPIVAICAALDALAASSLRPTWNVRVILDGEEEASSPSLVPAIAQYRDELRADAMVILDGPIHSSGRPTLAYGARGIVTLNLTVFGPRVGVHSGNYGNWVPNPAQRLASLLATMKDDDGRVLVAGFNDGIARADARGTGDARCGSGRFGRDAQDVRHRRAVEGVSPASGGVAVSDAERPRVAERTRRRRRAHDHPGPRDGGDGYQARQGNEPREPRRQAARPRPRAGLPPRRRRAYRCRPRRALEAGRDCRLRVADEGLPHLTE